ncbi:hypothetical protein CIG1485E_0050 [Campylobacter iguaniorum]|uniref:Uncharacterized protein n=1 Tax=Campylobacter iguaniorum TaxID=1244531 RepID=A0A076F6J4_9BACT|nr:hypothetical protein [Campylobacter iguaniorum]AII13930.1 hypothetical protein CIG1485E_0050 [Campylobacter iguaniorum]
MILLDLILRDKFKDEYQIYKKPYIIKVRTIMKGENRFNFVNKLKFIYKIISAVIYLRFKSYNCDYIYLEQDNNIKFRAKHMAYNFGINSIRGGGYKEGFYISSIYQFFIFFKKYFYNYKYIFLLFFDNTKIDWNDLANFLNSALAIDLQINSNKSYFIYNLLNANTYLLANYIIAQNKKCNVYCIYSSCSSTYFNCRYDSFKNTNICFCSKVLNGEFEYFIKKGWLRSCNNKFINLSTDFIYYDINISKKIKRTISFYSSGHWARYMGLYQIFDKNKIKTYYYKDNLLSNISNELINFLYNYSVKNGLKFKIHLHPYEKSLIKNYNVFPPYFEQYRQNIVDVNIDQIYDNDIGVTLGSSVFYDRHNYNLDTFMMCDINCPAMPRLVYVSKEYRQFLYKDISELEYKLNQKLLSMDISAS